MLRPLLVFYAFIFVSSAASAQIWKNVPRSPSTASRIDDIWFVNDTTGWAVMGSEVYHTSAPGTPWTLQLTTGIYNRAVEFINDSTGFIGTLHTAVYKTTNSGIDWIRIDQDFPVQVPGVCGMTHRSDSIFMVGSYFGAPYVLRSFNGGTDWMYQDMSELTNGLVDAWFKSADTVFISGVDHDQRGIILRSVNAGETWSVVSPGNGIVPISLAWKLDFPTPSVGYASLEEVYITGQLSSNKTHILKTTDGGSTWSLMEVKIGKNINIQGIGFIDANHGWIGGWSTGMYETEDGGLTWTQANNFANLNRFFRLDDDAVFFSGTAIFRLSPEPPVVPPVVPPVIPPVIVTAAEPTTPSRDIHVLEVYPNPAHQETTVKVTLGTRTMVVLTLRDMSGKIVREVFRGYTDAGVHRYHIDFKNLAAGEYAIVLLTNEHFLGTKLVRK
jgi:photosystem II stability/assembly factor-like uncharacterized protein